MITETVRATPSRGVEPIRSTRIFDELRHSPRRGRHGSVAVSFVPNSSWSQSQVAYAIGRRVGGAVVRNRMKRRMRAIMSELAPDRPQGAYLVRAGSDSPQLSFDELKVAMSRAVDKATKPKVERTTPRGDTRPTRAHQDAVE